MNISTITRLLLLSSLLPFSSATLAQNYPSMNQQDMQKMMQQAKKMETCMQNVDPAKMKEMEQRARKFEAEIKSLCASGKREEAMDRAISLGKEMSSDPTLQTMKKCGEMMKGMMPEMPFMNPPTKQSKKHICD